MGYKPCKFCKNRTFRSNLSENFSFGACTPVVAPMGVKFGMEEALLHDKFHPHRCNVLPLWGEKPQNRPQSKLNTGRLALRAMLPVISSLEVVTGMREMAQNAERWAGVLWPPRRHRAIGSSASGKLSAAAERLPAIAVAALERQLPPPGRARRSSDRLRTRGVFASPLWSSS